MDQLQELLGEFGCNVLNYINNKIVVYHFYNEERYNDFLNGAYCIQGLGLFGLDETLEYNKLNDNILVIVQNDGVETRRYKYVPIEKATMIYKDINSDNKKVNKTLTFTIRKEQYTRKINFNADKIYIDFDNMVLLKAYLSKKYGDYELKDRRVFNGYNDID